MKVMKVILAIALCLCLCVPAVAETEGVVLRIRDVKASSAGQEVLDMTGVALELQGGALENGIAARLAASVDGNDVLGATANIGETLGFIVDGMSVAGTIDLQSLAGMMGLDGVVSDTSSMGEAEINAMMSLVMNFSDLDFMNYVTETSTEEYDGVSYERTDFYMDENDTVPYIEGFLNCIDNAGMITTALYETLGLDEGTTIAEIWNAQEMSVVVDGSYWYAADDDYTYDVYVTIQNGESYVDVEYWFDTKLVDGEPYTQGVLSLYEGENEKYAITWDISNEEDVDGIPFNQIVVDGYDLSVNEEGDLDFDLYVIYYPDFQGSPVLDITLTEGEEAVELFGMLTTEDDVTDLYLEFSELENDEATERVVLDIIARMTDGVNLDITVYTIEDAVETANINLVYDAAVNGGMLEGDLTVTIGAEGQEVATVNAGLDIGVAMLDEAALTVDMTGAVDLLSGDSEAWTQEMMGLLQGGAMMLVGKVPALAQLFA